MTVDRKNTEICDQSWKMWAEGTSDVKPIETDIEALLANENWESSLIDIWFDDMMGFWRWTCGIKKL